MIKKFLLIVSLLLFTFCSKQKDKEKKPNTKNNIRNSVQLNNEHKSIHQQEWEEHNKKTYVSVKEQADIQLKQEKVLTGNLTKHFIAPFYNPNGTSIFFTTEGYNGIWLYDLQKEEIQQLNSLPGSGFKFEISETGNSVFFRNKTFKKNSTKAQYTIVQQTVNEKEINILYMSKNVLTPPVQLGNEIIFLENNKPKAYNLKTKKIENDFKSTFIYVINNKLVKFKNGKKENISLNGIKPVKTEYTSDKKNIICLTATKGILLLDKNGLPVNHYPKAFSLSKLNNSNLVVFTEEKYKGNRIIQSDVYLGFTDSDKKIKLSAIKDKKVFNPVWSPNGNNIAYNNEDGIIKIITLKIKPQEK